MAHDPSRGAIVAAGFGLAFVVSLMLLIGEHLATKWDREVLAESTATREAITDLDRTLADAPTDAGLVIEEAEEPVAIERD